MGKISLKEIKDEISRSGTSRGKFFYLKEGSKARLRILTDFEDGMSIKFHDNYVKRIGTPCRELFGEDCPFCDMEDIRTRNNYIWSAYDYDQKETKILMFAVNSCTPVGSMASMYETYGTLKDRDYEFKRSGKGTNTTYSVVPLDKSTFRNKEVREFSEQAIIRALREAYPLDEEYRTDDGEEEELPFEEEKTKKKRKVINPPEDEEDDEAWPDEEEPNYENMTAKELYQICMREGIKCEPRRSKDFYLDLLEDW